jgi:Ca2+-binding RTX toxin-like protein
MATVNTNLTFSTEKQSLWRPGPATDLTVDSRNELIWDPDPIVKTFGFSALGFSLDAEFYLDVRFGLLAYASLGTGGHFDAEFNISVAVDLPTVVIAGEAMRFDFSQYSITSSSITTAGFGTPESSGAGKIGAGLDLIVEAETGFRNIVFGHWFGEEGPHNFTILDIKERIELISVSPLDPEFSLDLTEGVTLTARLPTGASILESTATKGGGRVAGEGASERQFLSLDADLDALLVKMLNKIALPPVQVVAKFLGEVVFAEHSYDIADFLPFIGKGKAAFNFTLLDVTANAGLVVTEEVSLDITKSGTSIPDIVVTLVSDNGTAGNTADDITVRGALGQQLTILSPNRPGVGDAIITATYEVNRATFFHGVGVGINASINIDALSGYLTGSWVPEALRFSFGPLFSEQIPEGGAQINLGNLYTDTFEIAGSAFNTETDSYRVLFVERGLAPTGYNSSLPNAEETLYAYFRAVHEQRAAIQATYSGNGFDIQPPEDSLLTTFDFTGNAAPVMFVWEGGFDATVTLNSTNGSVATVDLAAPPTVPANSAIFSGLATAGLANSGLANTGAYNFLTLANPFENVFYRVNGKSLITNGSVNVEGTANNDFIYLYRDDTSFIDGGAQLSGGLDTFMANFAAYYGDVAIRWDLEASVTAEQDGNPATMGGITLFDQDPAITDLTVRNIERALLRTGAADDYLVGWLRGDVFVTGGGDDIVIMPGDNAADLAVLEGGDDVYVTRFVISPSAATLSDVVYGGSGIDNVFVTPAARGLRYNIVVDSFESPVPAPRFAGGIGADASFADISQFYSDLRTFGYSTVASNPGAVVATVNAATPSYYVLLSDGAGTHGLRLARDVEYVSIVDGGAGNDLAIFMGGTRYEGGAGIDTFGADFSQTESAFGTRGGINIVIGRTGIDGFYGETVIDGFERLLVAGTTARDVLVGGVLGDFLGGGDGNDVLSGGEGSAADTVSGGDGNDLITWVNGGADDILGGNGIDRLDIVADGLESHGLRYRFVSFSNKQIVAGSEPFYSGASSTAQLRAALDFTRTLSSSYSMDISFVSDVFAKTYQLEVTNIRGSVSGSDLLIYQSGISYIGGETADDQDAFVADLSGFGAAITFVIKDDEALDGSEGYTLANTIYVEGIDRGILTTGSGNDLLVGGRWNDYFAAGAGADTLYGAAGDNELHGGDGNDLLMWMAEGNGTITGGASRDLNARDVLVQSGGDAASSLRVFLASGVELTTAGPLTASSSHASLAGVVDQALFASRFVYDAGSFTLDYANISRVEFAGTDAHDEIVLFQYGENHLGGERAGDADLFAGDFRFKVNPGRSFGDMVFDARTGAVYEAAEDLKLGGFERFHLLLGDGTHLVRGGDLSDFVEGTTGFITFLSGAGNDFFYVGNDGGLFEHTGGADTLFGAGSNTTLVYTASGAAEVQLLDVNGLQIGPTLSRVGGLQDRTVFEQALSTTSTNLLTHGGSSVLYSGVSEVFATGSAGNDVLLGGFGQSLLAGGAGDDVLIVRHGNHVLMGGTGADTYVFDDLFGSAVILNEIDTSTDTILMFTGATFAELAFGSDGLDLVITTSPPLVISSTLRVVDYFAAGPNGSNFAIMTTDAFVTIDLSGFGAFTGLATAAPSLIFGTEADDDFGPGNHVGREIHMGAGDDFARAGAGEDRFFGGVGQDGVSYVDATGGVTVNLGRQIGTGNHAEGDIYSSIEHAAGSRFDDRLLGSAKNNTFVADLGNDTLSGIDGDDALFGGLGDDSLDGGNDDDVLQGDEGQDTLLGGFGNDVLRGGEGNDSLDGGEDDDLIETGNGNDSVQGGTGDDVVLYVGGGLDSIDGGLGRDWVDFSQHTAPIEVNLLTAGTVFSTDGVDIITIATLTGIENLRGTDFGDVLVGNNLDNVIDGGLGFDAMTGHAGADTFISAGQFGFVDYGAETGTQGVNLVFQAFTPGLSPHIAGTDSHGHTDRLFNIRFIQGTSFADNIQGDDEDNELSGGEGNDVLGGLNGDDLLFGQGGNDLLLGFFGRDTLLGGEGSNTLRGEEGNDLLIADGFTTFDNMFGGAGFDTAAFDQFEAGLTINGSQVFAGAVQIASLDGIEQVVGGTGNDEVTLSAPNPADPSSREFLQVYAYTGGLDEVAGTSVFLGGRNTLSFTQFDAAMHVRMASGIARTDDATTITGDGTRRAVLFDDIHVVVGSRYGDYLEGDVMRPLGQTATVSELQGGDGNDTLVGLGGDTVLIGGAGDDLIRIFVPQFSPTVLPPIFFYAADGGDGVDSLQIDGLTGWDIDLTLSYSNLFFVGIENFIGSTGDDTLTGDAGANGFRGGLGNDVFFSGDGDDTLTYASGIDAFTGGAGIDTLDLSEFTSAVAVGLADLLATARTNDTPTATGGVFRTIVTAPGGDVEGVLGTGFNDSISGNALNNILAGGLGNDTLRGGAGNDLLIYGAGIDLLDGGADRDTASFAGFQLAIDLDLTRAGIEVFHRGAATLGTGAPVNMATLVAVENAIGTAQADALRGDDLGNMILGNGGADLIAGRGGNDSLFGGDLSDTLQGGDGDDSLIGGVTEADLGDSIDAGSGEDTVFGGAGNDTILGGSGADQLRGETGHDSIDGGAGGDSIAGGRGNDTLLGGSGDGLDSLSGGEGDDVLIGGVGASSVQEGGSGDDLLTAGTTADTLCGGDGNDTLVAGGLDDIDGGAGFDIVSYAVATSAVFVVLSNSGKAVTDGAAIFDRLFNVEGVLGGLGNDTLAGNKADNRLHGGDGNDELFGDAGDDVLEGGAGQDRLDGNEGRDLLKGQADDDTLMGAEGDDLLQGDAGNDSLLGGDGADEMHGGADNDTLRGEAGDDTLNGDDGADTLDAGTGNDAVNGGAGNDILIGSAGGDALDGGEGIDTADYSRAASGVVVNLGNAALNNGDATGDTYASIENVTGSVHADSLAGDALANRIEGGSGDDTIEGGGGNDIIEGGDGAGDVAIYTGNRADYLASTVGGQLILADQRTGLADGTDTITGVEIFRFADGDVAASSFAAPSLAIAPTNADRGEGQSGTTAFTFTVTRSGDLSSILSVAWATIGSGARPAASADFVGGTTAQSGTLNLAANEASQTITVQVAGDTRFEGDEGFTVTLSNPSNGVSITTASASGVIREDDIIIGTAANDTLTGTSFADSIRGLVGDDVLQGGSGDDTIEGNEGADTLVGGTGADSLIGGDGLDTVSYFTAGAAVALSLVTGGTAGDALGDRFQGIETVLGSGFADAITGDDQTNLLVGNAGNDSLTGGAGDDRMTGGAGVDRFAVDSGTDTITDLGLGGADLLVVSGGATANATLAANWVLTTGNSNGGTANITAAGFNADLGQAAGSAGWAVSNLGTNRAVSLTGSARNDTLTGGNGNDTLTGGGANDSLLGDAGSDSLTGGTGNDTMTGGAAVDRFVVDAGTDTITDLAAGGNDVLVVLAGATANATLGDGWAASSNVSNAGVVNITAAGFNVNLTATTGFGTWSVTQAGQAGAVAFAGSVQGDRLTGGLGADSLAGNAGDDTLTGGDGADTLNGGAGIDSLVGGLGDDSLTGGGEVDRFRVEAGTDTITDLGFGGTDALIIQAGAAVVATIGGHWTASGGSSNAGSASVFAAGFDVNVASVGGASGWALSNAGQSRGVSLVGSGNADSVTGGSGADTLRGQGGADSLSGGGGNDQLFGGAGNDTMTGGAGIDRFTVDAGTDVITDLAAGGVDVVIVSAGATLQAMLAADWVATAASSNAGVANLSTAGFDVNLGAAAGSLGWNVSATTADAVALTGSRRADVLMGGAGADTLIGGAGNDTLVGGAGADHLTGGVGADSFRFDSAADATGDVVTDFNAAQGDKLDLRLIDANAGLAGDQAFAFIGSTGFGSVAGELRFAAGVLEGDVDGDGAADFQIQLSGVASLTDTNFWL